MRDPHDVVGEKPLEELVIAEEPTSYQLAILAGLQSKHVYAGTVPAKVKAARRAAGKRARVARKAGRK